MQGSWGLEVAEGEIAETAEGVADGCAVAGTVPTAMDANTHAHAHIHTQKGKGDRGIKSKAGREGHRGPGNWGWGSSRSI